MAFDKNAPVEIYTDGACSGNPGPGGYGIVFKFCGNRKEVAQGYRMTTNNRMELLAVIVALESLKYEGLNVFIYSDSQYVVDAVEKGWLNGWITKNFKNVKNPDLWMRFINSYHKNKIKFIWVRGHADNAENNRCDELATAAARTHPLMEDEGFESSRIP